MKTNWRSSLTLALGIAAFLTPTSSTAQNYVITTAAGGANPHFLSGTGDGGAATAAGLGNPTNDVAIDSSGNLYIATGSLVRKVSTSGIISTAAGGGSSIGDGVPAVQAEILPTALTVDAAGNLYIADSTFGISRVRKVDTKGIITTVAGGAACCGLGDGGPATKAYIGIPYGIAVDGSGNVFIAQASGSNNRIRQVSANGNISTVAGGGQASGDGGPATGANLARPTGVAVDSVGNLYIADASDSRIRKVSKAGVITTVTGIQSPWHVAVDSTGNLYVTHLYDATVRMVTATGTITTIAGNGTHGFSGDGGPAITASLDRPAGIGVGSRGLVYVADATSGVGRVRLLTPTAQTGGVPSIKSGGVVSASAYGQFTSIAPGSWIEIFGSNLSVKTREWAGGDFNGVNAPTSLDGTTVTVGGVPAFLDYISPGQLAAQVSSAAGTGPQTIVVTTPAGASAPYPITINPVQPGLLAPFAFSVGGNQHVGATFQDGVTYVLPPGAINGVLARRAKAGDIITLYGIGFGPVSPSIPAGQVVQKSNRLTLPFTVLFGQTPASIIYAGLAPNFVGLYEFFVVVPGIPASDAVPLRFTLGGVSGTQTLYIAVQ